MSCGAHRPPPRRGRTHPLAQCHSVERIKVPDPPLTRHFRKRREPDCNAGGHSVTAPAARNACPSSKLCTPSRGCSPFSGYVYIDKTYPVCYNENTERCTLQLYVTRNPALVICESLVVTTLVANKLPQKSRYCRTSPQDLSLKEPRLPTA